MQPGTAVLTLTSDTDIDSLGSLVLALDTRSCASEVRRGSTFIPSVIFSETASISSHCGNTWSCHLHYVQ